jgi:hypothetical protein
LSAPRQACVKFAQSPLSSFDRDPGSAWSGKTDVDVDTYVLRGIKDWDVDEPASPSLEKRSRQE